MKIKIRIPKRGHWQEPYIGEHEVEVTQIRLHDGTMWNTGEAGIPGWPIEAVSDAPPAESPAPALTAASSLLAAIGAKPARINIEF